MNYLYKIEQISYIENIDEIWNLIDQIDQELTPRDLIQIIDYFISNLSSDHRLPGSDYYQLCGIGDWVRTHNDYTPRQMKWVILTIAQYWYELDQFSIKL